MVVVGAGIGGLAASLVLSRVAAQITLVERAERPREVGAAFGFTGERHGGVGPSRAVSTDVVAASTRIDRLDIRSASGRMLMSAVMPDLGAGSIMRSRSPAPISTGCCFKPPPMWPRCIPASGAPR